MGVTLYKSSDASAPVLTGQVGSFIALLDACLVNGYGAKAAAGWTKPFSGTNLAVYRMTTTGGATGFYINVSDAAPDATAGAREAYVRGFETKTGTDTHATITGGTNPIPTVAQAASGIVVRKSWTADATARPWIIIADNKTVYIFILSGDFIGYTATAFGDFYSYKSADAYKFMLIGRIVIGTLVTGVQPLDTSDNLQSLSAITGTITGHFIARNVIGSPIVPVLFGKHGNAIHNTANLIGVNDYPNPSDNSLMLSKVFMHIVGGTTSNIRGRLRGFWHFLHPLASPVNDGDTIAGAGDTAGKTFLIIKPVATGLGMYCMEISDTWETSS